MNIALFYRNFSEIYFPIRIDQRGRIYCTSHYFNELSKSLLLFAVPGTIKINDMSSIKYLKAYGAN